jgi:xanthine dehydrogenase accessory factor
MRDVFPIVKNWFSDGGRFAIAIVINTWGSSPRKAGSWMIVNEEGEFHGSVSGGCVESAVIDEALRAIESQLPKKLHFGVADDTAWEVGLACGGEIDIFVRPFPMDTDRDQDVLRDINQGIGTDEPFILTLVLDGPKEDVGRILVLPSDQSFEHLPQDPTAKAITANPIPVDQINPSQVGSVEIINQPLEVYYHFNPTPSKLVIVGGAHVSIALAKLAKVLGYRVYIIDPRGIFGTSERFPRIDGLIKAWPDKGLVEVGLDPFTAIAVLSHDPKLDDPALRIALQSQAFYVGALGSRKTQEKRKERLLDQGLSSEIIARLHAPVGLDIGGSSPEEIALSVMAEIVATKNGITSIIE